MKRETSVVPMFDLDTSYEFLEPDTMKHL
jgi:hypothetical protein